MDDRTTASLNRGGIADITTTGRRTKQPRRTEIYFHQFDGRYFVTGKPAPRDWVANLNADPQFVLHLKNGLSVDLPAIARQVTDAAERERIIWRCLTESWQRDEHTARGELTDRVANGLLLELTIVDTESGSAVS